MARAETVTMLMYSARKNSANLNERVLGVEAADQLGLGLGQVERGAVGLADHGDQVDDERHEQRDARTSGGLLGVDDARGRHGAAKRNTATMDRPIATS